MLNEKWMVTKGINNMDESNEKVVAKKTDDAVIIAYVAYAQVKVVEVSGIDDMCLMEDTGATIKDVWTHRDDNWEVALPVVIDDQKVLLSLDENGEFEVCSAHENVKLPEIVSDDLYEIDDAEDFDEDFPELEGLAEAIEIV